MTEDVLVNYGWAFASLLALVACAWAVLIVQALLHDRRIALVGLAGSVVGSLAMVVSGRLSMLVGIAAALLVVGFLLWFILRYWCRPFVYLPVAAMAVSSALGAGLYLTLT